MLSELADLTRMHSPKRRNSDIMNEDSPARSAPTQSQIKPTPRSTLETPFKSEADQDFDGYDRTNSHYSATTSWSPIDPSEASLQ